RLSVIFPKLDVTKTPHVGEVLPWLIRNGMRSSRLWLNYRDVTRIGESGSSLRMCRDGRMQKFGMPKTNNCSVQREHILNRSRCPMEMEAYRRAPPPVGTRKSNMRFEPKPFIRRSVTELIQEIRRVVLEEFSGVPPRPMDFAQLSRVKV